MLRTFIVLALAAGCGSAPKPLAHHTSPAVVPPDAVALAGPERCADDCGVTSIRTIDAAGIRRIGIVARGLDSTLAIETSSGWFFERAGEPRPEMRPHHHEPRSHGYDLAKTRVEDGAIVVRIIDAQSVFYPGQGNAGSSRTTWLDQRCMVADGRVVCRPPAQIATKSCTTENVGAGSKTTCTGNEPPA